VVRINSVCIRLSEHTGYRDTGYWLLLRGGIIQSVSCTAAIFSSIVRPHMSSNHSWFIHQSSLANTSRDT